MRDVLFLQAANHLDDYRAAGFVVATQHGRAIGANDVAFNDWFHAFAGNDRVHVRAHHDRLGIGNRAREARDDIAGVAADGTASVVDLNLRAHFLAVLLEALGDIALLARVAVYLHEFEQKILNAFLVDHLTSEEEFQVSSFRFQVREPNLRLET